MAPVNLTLSGERDSFPDFALSENPEEQIFSGAVLKSSAHSDQVNSPESNFDSDEIRLSNFGDSYNNRYEISLPEKPPVCLCKYIESKYLS